MFLKAQLKENRDVRDYIAKKLVNSGYILRDANICYDSKLAMDTELLIKFFEKTQPDEIAKFRKIHKVDADKTLINTINNQITNPNGKGLIGCLKDGVEVGNNIKFKLMYQIPSTTKNPELNKQYQANTLSVMKEVNCTPKERVDLVIFLNGLAIISFELKCNPAGQTYKNAIAQYRNDRSYNNRLFQFKAGCLVNFALDLEEVYMCSKLEGKDSFFLPFNMGQGEGINAGAGNPTPDDNYPTHYMWDQILQKDNLLELIGKFIFIDKQETINEQTGKRKVKEILVFPRFHQLDAIQKILADVKDNHSDCNYLIQHSAGSGKTYTIAWLAHRLASIHDHDDKVVYDSVLVVTDRVVVDRQLQNAIRALDHKEGFIKVMDDSCTSADLADAINGRTKIIGTTIQKFRFILDEVKNLKDRKFAIIIDEAHSSTAGKNMLAANIALGEFDEKVVDTDNTTPNQYDEIEKELEKTGKPKNVSVFAFTATPKNKTLELFGKLNVSGQKEAFHRYTMKQAIEEGFILDVLGHYMEYDTYL
jgi:type I restriction enzyme R subunit